MNARATPLLPPDAPLSGLNTVELLVVTTVRLWVGRRDRPEAGLPDWQGGLRAAGIAARAAPALGALLRIVAAAAYRPLDIRCTCCTVLGDDESRLLQMLSLLQWSRPREAGWIMAAWLPPAARRMALLPAQGFAAALTTVGLELPLRWLPSAPLHAFAFGQERTLQ